MGWKRKRKDPPGGKREALLTGGLALAVVLGIALIGALGEREAADADPTFTLYLTQEDVQTPAARPDPTADPPAEPTEKPASTSKPTPNPTEKPASTPKPAPKPTEKPASTPAAVTYILNTNTKKFHWPDCSSVADIKPGNYLESGEDRETVMGQGYVPCKRCRP